VSVRALRLVALGAVMSLIAGALAFFLALQRINALSVQREMRTCQVERQDRAIDRQIAKAMDLHISIPANAVGC
jgi:hypothetical protein